MSIVKHSFVNIAGQVMILLVTIVTVPLYIKYIGAEVYGVLVVLWALLGYFVFLDFGFGRAIAQRMASLDKEEDAVQRSDLFWTAFNGVLAVGFFGAALLGGAYYFLSDVGVLAKVQTSTVLWLLVSLPLLLVVSVLQGVLQARLYFVSLNIIQVFCAVLGQVAPLLLVMAGYKQLEMLVIATLLSRVFLMAILLLAESWRVVPVVGKPMVDLGHLKALASYGGWMSLITILAPILTTMDRLIIASISGTKALTYFYVPFNAVSKLVIVPSGFVNALFPRLVTMDDQDGRDMADKTTQLLVAFMTPVTIFFLFVIPYLIEAWLGQSFYSKTEKVAEIILFGLWFNTIVFPYHSLFLARQSPKNIAFIYLFEIPIYLGMLWWGLSLFGIMGAAIAWSARVIIDTTLLFRLNQVLVQMINTHFISLLLVAASLFLVLYGHLVFDQYGLWLAGAIMFFVSFMVHKSIMLQAYNRMIRR